MTRNLKVLGVALAAVLAMSAFASAASAAEFRSPAIPTNVTVTQLNENAFGSTAGSVTCASTIFTAVMTATVQSSVQTNSMAFSGCHIIILGSTVSATVSSNGCNYKLYSAGSFDLVCTAGSSMEVKAAGCTVKVGGQTGLKSVSYSNNGNHIDVKANISGIAYSHSGFLCGTGSGTNGTLVGNTTMAGESTGGLEVNLDYS